MVINPALSSATPALTAQSTTVAPSFSEKISDKSSAAHSAAGNSTVSLSDKAKALSSNTDFQKLTAHQQVNPHEAVENKTTEPSETTSGSSYASNLQSRANYYTAIAQQTVPSKT